MLLFILIALIVVWPLIIILFKCCVLQLKSPVHGFKPMTTIFYSSKNKKNHVLILPYRCHSQENSKLLITANHTASEPRPTNCSWLTRAAWYYCCCCLWDAWDGRQIIFCSSCPAPCVSATIKTETKWCQNIMVTKKCSIMQLMM